MKLNNFLREELTKLFISMGMTVLLLTVLAIWRNFETDTFIFLQIIACSMIILSALYLLRLSNSKFKIFNGNELLTISISFIVVTFLLLNIDRSRSFFLLKWVASSGSNGITVKEIQEQKGLSETDLAAVKQRIQEQDQSGFIIVKNEKIYISREGKILVFIFRNLASIENLKGYENA